jgi:hypothetical protein
MYRNDRERIANLANLPCKPTYAGYAKVRAPEKAFEQILQF